ncbi:Class III cytochrome C family protein [Posidoniimonas polymericola]|uniref:Class III cytochrome C family protein n=1 Tax=Posidoniimonas polymericola TaxID=2528002 RepID=A0A5C5YT67_9BACT|nr:cytochrome c3 family protein [Posidoniimonas polymericola]TWT78192.1 Class III cytochrome C family protein [Posidoniimonas polymericola]
MDRFHFPPWVNTFTLMVLGGVAAGGAYVGGMFLYGTWPSVMNAGYAPEQPVPFSHKLHAGDLKMDCRYCHNTVETSAHAAVPGTNVCANCHRGPGADGTNITTAVHTASLKLLPIREAITTGEPMKWERVHDLGDYVYFNHSVHVKRGVSCVECHGRIDQMERVEQVKPLSMSWCLECHRNPAPRLRPVEEVTNLGWEPPDGADTDRQAYGEKLQDENDWAKQAPTSCSTCHR